MFVGEAPGYHEDQQARPFVGPAGQLLTQLLQSIGIKREDVFITNIVKCRPPHNRDPQPDEIDACREYLDTQIALLRPRIVSALGRFAMTALLDPRLSISQSHGVAYRKGGLLIVPLFHPAAALHKGSMRETIFEDFRKLKAILEGELRGEPAPAQEVAEPAPPRQAQLSFE
jgi:DNA polymerase